MRKMRTRYHMYVRYERKFSYERVCARVCVSVSVDVLV